VTTLGLWLFQLEWFAFRIAILIFGGKLLRSAWHARWGAARAARPPDPTAWPLVTIQLPILDEYYVVERLLRATWRLDYPHDRFEIQVLDDSSDETSPLIDRVVAELRASGAGPRIDVVRRASRVGFKAGSLACGLESARGEVIAMFDADAEPPASFLKHTIAWLLADPKCGMVQARWGFSNEERSMLTRLAALPLHGLMSVEQPAASALREPFQFNGTAGVWRRMCIDDAGGWTAASVTEDLDLSFRALMRGWTFQHLADLVVPTELPTTALAYRAQQQRWTTGNFQVLRSLSRAILASSLPLRHRLAMCLHMMRRSIYAFQAILVITYPLTTFELVKPPITSNMWENIALLGYCCIAQVAYLWESDRVRGRSPVRMLLLLPLWFGLNLGLSFSQTRAVLVGLRGKPVSFVKTPKLGDRARRGPRYRAAFDPVCLLELAIGGVYLVLAMLCRDRGYIGQMAFCIYVAIAFSSVGVWTLLGNRERRPVERAIAVPTLAVDHGRVVGE
jgi:cellulose synthase/poly-beta-1,6-N-acetylglucosamine synthase-like glycosyltransferase